MRGRAREGAEARDIQGYLAHTKQPSPLGPPQGPRHTPTVGFYGGLVSYERGTPVGIGRGRGAQSAVKIRLQWANRLRTSSCMGSEEGSYSRLIDLCITLL